MSVEMKVPPVGESITEIVLSQWIKNDGDYVEMDEVIAEMESDKATFELTAEKDGILKTKVKEGDTVPVGDVICVIEEGKAPADKKEEAETTAADKEEEIKTDKAPADGENKTGGYADGHPSPAAAKVLAEKGVDPKDVNGTGKGGRVTKDDALKAEKSGAKPVETKKAEEKPLAATAAVAGSRNERRQRMPNLRKTIAKRLVTVQNETAMLTTFNEADMAPIMKLRKKYKEQFKEKYGVGLGFMSFFTKACCQALKEFPDVNGRIDGEEIVYNDYVDVSIAVSTPRGLVVPVIRNAESMSLDQIEAEIVVLATKARDGKLTIEEMTGGTFTITNGGVFGSMMSTPIINAPQSAILGMHNIVERPIAVNGEVVVRPMMYLALSYDHRIIDGKQSVSFLVRVKQLLEDPARLLIGV